MSVLVQDAMWKIRSGHVNTDKIFVTYGRAVLVMAAQDDSVKFYPDAGRATPRTLTQADFADFFEFCHLTGTVCQHCHSAPGRLKI